MTSINLKFLFHLGAQSASLLASLTFLGHFGSATDNSGVHANQRRPRSLELAESVPG